jgi:protein SCO1
LAVFLATSGGLWMYYRNEKQKILAKSNGNILINRFIILILGNLEKAGAVGTPMIGGPFNLIDSEGLPFSDKDLLGKYYLLYFGFTHCPDICPEELGKIAEITKRIKIERGDDVNFVPVFVTCDPERDTPEVIKSYLKGKNIHRFLKMF